MNTYKVNPLSAFSNLLGGIGISDLYSYKKGMDLKVYENPSDPDYYKILYNGSDSFGTTNEDGLEYKLTSKSSIGFSIADRWCELVNGEDVFLIEMPVMKLNQSKIINKTQVYGYEGTIKEMVALSDWEIDFTFYIYGRRHMEINQNELIRFLELNTIKTEININSPLLNNVYDIDKVVIESVNSITEHETYNNIMVVNLTMLSDKEYEPFIKQKS
jgi:hypothetical protein